MNLKNRYLMLILLAFLKGVGPDLPGSFYNSPTAMISTYTIYYKTNSQ